MDRGPVPLSTLVHLLASLATTSMVYDLAEQVVNAGIARGEHHVETLAAFALAHQLILWMCSFTSPLEYAGMMLVDSCESRRKLLYYVSLFGLSAWMLALTLALTPLGHLVINDLHRRSDDVADATRLALLWMGLYPFLDAVARVHRGILVKQTKRSDIIWLSSLLDIGTQTATVFYYMHFPPQQPIWLPVVAFVAGVSVHATCLLLGYWMLVANHLPARPAKNESMTLTSFLKFSGPLCIVQLAQRSSRPLINLSVSRLPGGTTSLAVLGIVYPVAHFGYGWINNARSLMPAFCTDREDLLRLAPVVRQISRFVVGCGVISLAFQLALLYTPLVDVVVQQWIGASPELSEAARLPLRIFAFNTIPVTARAIAHSWCTAMKETKLIAFSAAYRFGAVTMGLLVYPFCWPDARGAVIGILALISGFSAEAAYVLHRCYTIRRQFLRAASHPPAKL
ncbi:uncharacterized protein MONBRDRAFT_13565 [Monosiga brevicollis MX1]|uniref:Protein RFT1 homolog n=1 Tax=Monosiga brevicollis TaxID=81824 RepID=A9UQU9_MONBE|nr:uncharacterized protein MONBRDRAFT_13565 [Monosiga brevicollis MX1]EDQ93109.1 predicted protein [Monosiga brevicollis MX1]|eukprot:XP_001742871.1 hypothetical protein [Monosiga brevicollis MX1]